MSPITKQIAFLVLLISSATSFADAFLIYGKMAEPIGFARLMDDREIEGCEYNRISGQVAHISRKGNGVIVEGFALGRTGSKVRDYVNVSFDRLSRADSGQLNQMLTQAVGKRVEIVEYRCGAAASMRFLDEIVFK